ncbi:penicillin acylase family protein [Litoreibacter arenae]|uniref:Penicillin amidase family protein n=1 Tax=Litoreibacter arenae DSM 19593 TaxID=1123360 RepID=S9QFU8_9RHOB|nr:penicillin acylase family protein [Litoreibacter arenae]EPX80311.1 Penicillin amidase family protein [Litoreibacter arenae DSM 19593]
MGLVFKWSLRLFLLLALLAGLALAGVYYLASRSLVDYNADYTVPAISGPVEIIRNNSGVPHIFAEDDNDVYYGLGFAHAQDRLWQMTMLRRTAQGRLSEQFGERTVKVDKLIRRLDLYGHAQRAVAFQDDRTRAALDAYAAGVNAWLRIVNRDALGRGAPEFFLFSPQIAPWQPADSIAVIKLMGLQLSGHLEEEVIRARTSLLLEPERVRDLLPDAPGTGIAALDYAALLEGLDLPRYAANTSGPKNPLSPFPERGLAGASNAFAAAPERSAAGGTLLANDPHLGLSAPSIWYLARLDLSTGGVIGGTIPGMPVILTGRSDKVGWGLTTAYVDDQDVLIEKVNPDNPDEYLTPDGYKPFRKGQSIIKIKDAPSQTINLRWTDNGPVLPEDHYNLGTITPLNHEAALSWTLLTDQDTSMQAGLQIMRAGSAAEVIAAAADYVAPAQNLTIVDQESIALKTIGHVPRRNPAHQSRGRIPSPGWLEQNRWLGVMPYASNPEFTRPSGGILGNTNNKVIDRPFPNHISYHYGDTQRVQRWRRLMLNREVHTRDSFVEAQLDTVSFTARSLLPLIAADLWYTDEAAPDGTPERQRQRALALMAEWNGEMSEHLPEPLIYAAWLRALQTRLIRDEIGTLESEFTHVEPLFIERVFRDVEGAAVWCDVLQSAPVETCTDISRYALDDALVWLEEKYGRNIESWRWGDAHEATHDHQVLGSIPLLSAFVNIRQSTSGGDNTLLRGRTSGKGPDPFQNVHAAGYRGVYDFADPDSSLFVMATGQSGHPLSRHYDDLGVLWRRGEYIPMSLDPELARAGAEGTITLVPE